MFDNTFAHRVLYKLACAALLPLCLAIAGWKVFGTAHALPLPAAGGEFPSQWQGRPLRPLMLTEVEQRFARQFPGTLARLTDGQQVLVLRTVLQPTRMLHPAADCYRGLGWRVAQEQLQQDPDGQLWRCFQASRAGQRLRVCERIVDAGGRGFTDTSAWYWAALLQQSRGPWQAITVASPS
ncbi:MAG: hypothetical protein JWP41_876 [Ramlibacter sp.]|nr:hypothetical protein [Ramlibacter sp.]